MDRIYDRFASGGQPVPLKAQQPPEEQANPQTPPGLVPLAMEQFQGINTSTERIGVPDEQCYWIDGFIPLDVRNLRTLYSNGAPLYTPGGALTIVCFYCANIVAVPYAVCFISDGSVVAVNLTSNTSTQILAASSVHVPTINNVGVSQWGQQYILIVANQTDGYWLWDGALLYMAGTLAPGVTITDPGSAYQTVPSVVISGGTGTGAQIAAAIAGGFVVGATVVTPGSGYSAGDVVTLTFVGGNSGGSGATLTANMTHATSGSGGVITLGLTTTGGPFGYSVTSATVSAGGAGYSQFTTVTVAPDPALGGAGAVLSLTLSSGIITAVSIVTRGEYSSAGPPAVTIMDGGAYILSSVTINNGGSGYSPSATITVTGGDSPSPEATVRPIITAGVVTGTDIVGSGVYSGATQPTLAVVDNVTTATGTVGLMPFGIQGNAIETYNQQVWIVNGPHLYFTAPGSFSDFAISSGGGNETSGDSWLRVGYTRLVNTGGFLYLIADSSVSYISGVVTNLVGTPPLPVTSFTFQNADPEVGSPYPGSVISFGKSILLANSVGIYTGNGGTLTKVSDALDGVYNSVPDFGGVTISAAKANIMGRKIFMALTRIVDPVSGLTTNKLLMFNGKRWFASEQVAALTFICSNEINSILTAYGTDGASLYQLFSTASAGLKKTVRSKLWDNPGEIFQKAVGRFYAMTKYYDVTSPDLTVSVENETEVANPVIITGPVATGYFITPPQAVGQQGVLLGMTISTTCKDMVLNTAKLLANDVGYRG